MKTASSISPSRRPDNAVLLLHGDGAGAFTEVWRTTATGPYTVVTGDFDVDANRDLAYSTTGTTVGVAFGNGAGGFETMSVTTSATASDMLAADANGDGRSDLMVFGNSTFTLHLAGASRTFGTGTSFASCLSQVIQSGPAFGDVTGDGKADVVAPTGSYPNGRITIWSGDGSGGFAPALCSSLGYAVTAADVVLTDINDDEKKDILVAGWGNGVLLYSGIDACGKTAITLHSPYAMPVAGDTVEIAVEINPLLPNKPSPTGTVTLKEGDTVLGQVALTSGWATFQVAGVTSGTHQYVATYDGDDRYFASSGSGTVDVAPAELSISITGPTESTYGASAVASATFGPSSPLIADRIKVSLTCGRSSSYGAQYDFAGCGAGEHTLVVSYEGHKTVPRGSASFTHTIRKGTPQLVVTPPNSLPATGTSATATWTVGVGSNGYSDSAQPTGTVTLMQGQTAIGSINVPSPEPFLRTTLPIGTHAGFSVTYSGDSNYEPAQSQPVSVTVYYSGPATLKALYRNGQVTFQYQFPNGTATAHFYRQRVDIGGITEVPATGEAMASGVHLYWFTAHDANGMTLGTTQKEVVVAMDFTDEDLTAGMVVKAAHFNEILAGTNLLRSASGLAPVTLETLTPGVTVIRAAHLTTLRDAINQGRIHAGAQPFPFSDVPVGSARPIRLLHMRELRDALR